LDNAAGLGQDKALAGRGCRAEESLHNLYHFSMDLAIPLPILVIKNSLN
jgi:hypothetical protein